jgi:hypothetical protein
VLWISHSAGGNCGADELLWILATTSKTSVAFAGESRHKYGMTTQHPTWGLEKLEAKATADIGIRLKEAYDLGRSDMRCELMTLLSIPQDSGDAIPKGGPLGAVVRTAAKAPPGTVRPAILAMIEASEGLLTEQILKATGFKENSVRGTLSNLQKQGEIERSAGRWIRKKSKDGPAVAEQDPDDAKELP